MLLQQRQLRRVAAGNRLGEQGGIKARGGVRGAEAQRRAQLLLQALRPFRLRRHGKGQVDAMHRQRPLRHPAAEGLDAGQHRQRQRRAAGRPGAEPAVLGHLALHLQLAAPEVVRQRLEALRLAQRVAEGGAGQQHLPVGHEVRGAHARADAQAEVGPQRLAGQQQRQVVGHRQGLTRHAGPARQGQPEPGRLVEGGLRIGPRHAGAPGRREDELA